MTRRGAISLLLGARGLGRLLDPALGCALLLDARTGQLLSSNGSVFAERGAFPPGSVIKPFVLASLIASGKVRNDETFFCPGRLVIEGRRMDCSHPQVGTAMHVDTALAYSCNCFVAHVAERFAPGELATALRAWGFTSVTVHSDQRLQALGEAGVLATPMEMAKAYRRLAAQSTPSPIIAGLEGAVEFGTGQLAGVSWAKLAGKTGSARKDNEFIAWFAGFLPSRAPDVVVTVMLSGKHGSSDAAPVARDVLETWKAGTSGVKVRLSAGGRIVELPLEKYVPAVLAGESKDFRSEEALKAMAVVARTYAIHMRGRHGGEGFDLCDTTHCQRVDLASVTTRLEAAARNTAGEMLWSDAKPAFTPYGRDCGGVIEEGGAPYLKSRPDTWCAKDSHWQWNAAGSQILGALQTSQLRAPQGLNRITILDRTPSGRASTLLLSGPGGSDRVSASSFRFAIGRDLGWNTLASDRYTIRMADGRFVFEGSGSGNGIGLCQHGAELMGRDGRTYFEILAHYFPGTTPGLNGQGLHWQVLKGETISLYTLHPAEDRVVLATAERLARGITVRSGWPVPAGTAIRVYPDLDSFRNVTAEPGWVAAHTDGVRIDLQPVRVLREKGALESTLTHELLHVMMEPVEAPLLPVWFREGVTAWLEHAPVTAEPRIPADEDLRQTTDAARARHAYAQAGAMVSSMVRSHGESAVLDWVKRGLPAELTKASTSHPAPKSR